MSIIGFLLEIFGAGALSLWGTHMVTSGMLRGFGAHIRHKVGQALAGRWKAFSTGLGVTLALQSSTATAMIATSFAASGLLSLEPGFMLMLGANVGTAVVAKVLSFPIHALAPLLMLVGVFSFRASATNRLRNASRVILGLGFMLMSLRLLVSSLDVLHASPMAQQVFQVMGEQPVAAIVFGALAAWICHSSVAVVLLVVSIAATGNLPLAAGMAAVLGANLGGALGPVLEADGLAARRLPLANLLVRAAGVAAGAALLPTTVAWLQYLQWSSPTMFVDAHLAFNLALAIVAAPLARPVSRLLMRLLPDPPVPEDPGRPRHLVEQALSQPAHMIVSAAERETLRVVDLLASQMRELPDVVRAGNPDSALAIARAGDAVTVLGAAIRRNLHAADTSAWSEGQAARAQEIEVFVLSMEHAADILAHQVADPMMRRHRKEGALADDQKLALADVSEHMVRAHELAVSAFLRRDLEAARQVIEEKMAARRAEREYNRTRAAEASTTTLLRPDIDDVLRMLREMGKIIGQSAAIAYELLEEAGQLRSRLSSPASLGSNASH